MDTGAGGAGGGVAGAACATSAITIDARVTDTIIPPPNKAQRVTIPARVKGNIPLVHLLVPVLVFLVTTLVPAAPAPDTTWPQFRGPSGRAVSAIDTLPTKWSTTINV